jgi:hypothetical protein
MNAAGRHGVRGVGKVNAMGPDLTGLANLSGLDFGRVMRGAV